ncbi:MAG: hypothetical protein AAGF23_04845 [Acidobacteriota bacterium]
MDWNRRWIRCAVLVVWTACLETSARAQEEAPAGAVAEEAATATIEPAPPADPDWFDKMLAREVEPLPATAVGSEDGFFSARLPATSIRPVQAVDDLYLLTLDFGPGPEELAECYVFRHDLDLAGSLLAFSDEVWSALGKTVGTIEAKAIYSIDAGGVGSWPYMGLDWLYRAKPEGGQPLAGQVKHLVASKQGHALYCQSSTVGYDDAFFGLFRSLVASVRFQEVAEAEPYCEELALVSIGGQAVGIARCANRLDADGDVEVRIALAMLLPVDDQTLQASDNVSVEYSTTSGDLISAVEVEASGGEVETQLLLSRTEAGWRVDGTFQGKELTADLGEAELHSDLQQRLELRALLATPPSTEDGAGAPSLTFADWMPDLDPTVIAETEIALAGEDPGGVALRISSGPTSYSAVADPESLSLIKVTLPLGAQSMEMERVYSRGDAFYPLELAAAAAAPDDAPLPEGGADGGR